MEKLLAAAIHVGAMASDDEEAGVVWPSSRIASLHAWSACFHEENGAGNQAFHRGRTVSLITGLLQTNWQHLGRRRTKPSRDIDFIAATLIRAHSIGHRWTPHSLCSSGEASSSTDSDSRRRSRPSTRRLHQQQRMRVLLPLHQRGRSDARRITVSGHAWSCMVSGATCTPRHRATEPSAGY